MRVKVGVAGLLLLAVVVAGAVFAAQGSTSREYDMPTEAERNRAIAQALVAAEEKMAPGAQREALANGEVSRDEYFEATDAELLCVGLALPTAKVHGPFPKAGGLLLDYTIEFEGPAPAEASAAMEECWNQHRKYLSGILELQMIPVGEEREALEDAARKCLADAGMSSTDQMSFAELARTAMTAEDLAESAESAVEDCLGKYWALSIEPDPRVVE